MPIYSYTPPQVLKMCIIRYLGLRTTQDTIMYIGHLTLLNVFDRIISQN